MGVAVTGSGNYREEKISKKPQEKIIEDLLPLALSIIRKYPSITKQELQGRIMELYPPPEISENTWLGDGKRSLIGGILYKAYKERLLSGPPTKRQVSPSGIEIIEDDRAYYPK